MLKTSLLFLYRFKFLEAYVSLNIDLGSIKAISFLDFADQIEQIWKIYCPEGLVSLGEVPYKGNFCEIYDQLFKNTPLVAIQILNFQRPISHSILMWDSLKFYYFWTLQIKLIIPGRSTAPKGSLQFGSYYLTNKQK